jgi:hypothetical protein
MQPIVDGDTKCKWCKESHKSHHDPNNGGIDRFILGGRSCWFLRHVEISPVISRSQSFSVNITLSSFVLGNKCIRLEYVLLVKSFAVLIAHASEMEKKIHILLRIEWCRCSMQIVRASM